VSCGAESRKVLSSWGYLKHLLGEIQPRERPGKLSFKAREAAAVAASASSSKDGDFLPAVVEYGLAASQSKLSRWP
jgi:hypothetical protein